MNLAVAQDSRPSAGTDPAGATRSPFWNHPQGQPLSIAGALSTWSPSPPFPGGPAPRREVAE